MILQLESTDDLLYNTEDESMSFQESSRMSLTHKVSSIFTLKFRQALMGNQRNSLALLSIEQKSDLMSVLR
jgi:hypothetical protein